MNCPKCSGTLIEKKYEGVEIDKCGSCEGIWLDKGELAHIIEKEEEQFSKELIEKTINSEFAGIPKEEKESEVSCPKCQKHLRPVNYSYSSGVIIDTCSEHGAWFEKSELDKIQAHREEWKKKAEANQAQWLEKVKSVEKGSDDRNEGPSNFNFMNRIVNSVINYLD